MASTATCDKSSPRPITTTVIPTPRIPSTDTLRTRVEILANVKKPRIKIPHTTKMTIVVANTSVSWLTFFML
jgi:hypothetical protein